MARTKRDRDFAPHVVIAGGGTGGHLFPGVAVAEALEALEPSTRVTFVGTKRGIEARVIPGLGYDLRCVEVSGLRSMDLRSTIAGLARLPVGALESIRLLYDLQPDLVVSLGSYAAGPITAFAALRGIPTALMEQNAVPGTTNGLLGRLVDRAYLTFEESAAHIERSEPVVTGNPLRRSIVEAARDFRYRAPEPGAARHLLSVGGSGGAGSINRDLPKLMMSLDDELAAHIRLRHQVGRDRLDEVEGAYEGFAGQVQTPEFIDDMARAYRETDLIVCRAGASTITEVLAFGLPAIYIPFPGAGGHQESNAREIVEAGAGVMLPDDEIESPRARRLLEGLLRNPISLQNLADRARQRRTLGAAETIARQCLDQISRDRTT